MSIVSLWEGEQGGREGRREGTLVNWRAQRAPTLVLTMMFVATLLYYVVSTSTGQALNDPLPVGTVKLEQRSSWAVSFVCAYMYVSAKPREGSS